MLIAEEFTFWDIFWLMAVAAFWFMVISLVVVALVDNFRRHDHSGFAKAGWTLFIIVFPLVGALVYQIARPKTPEFQAEWGDDRPTAGSARDQAARVGGLP